MNSGELLKRFLNHKFKSIDLPVSVEVFTSVNSRKELFFSIYVSYENKIFEIKKGCGYITMWEKILGNFYDEIIHLVLDYQVGEERNE